MKIFLNIPPLKKSIILKMHLFYEKQNLSTWRSKKSLKTSYCMIFNYILTKQQLKYYL